MGLFFLLQCSEWGVVSPKEILLTVWPHPPRFYHPSFSLQSLSHKEKGEEGRGHGWLVKSVAVVVVVGGGGGGGMVRRKRGEWWGNFPLKKISLGGRLLLSFVGLLWCCSYLGTDCEDLGCCCCWNKSWSGRKWVVESNLVVVGGVGGEGGEWVENFFDVWVVFGFFIEEFEV